MAARIQTVTLAAGVVTSITLTRDWSVVEVLNVNGAGPVFFRVDGVDPAVAGDEAWCVPGVAGAAVTVDDYPTGTNVRLISSAATQVTVAGIR